MAFKAYVKVSLGTVDGDDKEAAMEEFRNTLDNLSGSNDGSEALANSKIVIEEVSE